MADFISNHRRAFIAALAVLGIADMAWYSYCGGSCQSVAGKVAGLDLNYIGIAFMAASLGLLAARKDRLLALALAAAAGGEAFLVGYQISTGRYCQYCLLFGLAILAMLALAMSSVKLKHMAWSAVAGLALMSLLFTGAPQLPLYADETPMPVSGFKPAYGDGTTEVRLFTDYFCGPCHATEPKALPLIEKLVTDGKIRVVFVDTPLHEQSMPYAMLFVYAVSAKNDFQAALAARGALFRAARSGVKDNRDLVKRMVDEGIPLSTVDTRNVFEANSGYLKEDGIDSTPSMVVIRNGEHKKYHGSKAILKALDELAKAD